MHRNMIKKLIRPGDIIVTAAVLVVALVLGIAFAWHQSAADTFYINYDGETVEYPLAEDGIYSITSNGIGIVVKSENCEVSVISSECPDRLCVKASAISNPGETIVCLPAKVVVGIKASQGGVYEADGIVG